jgi:YVTN family beta-propeller protein
MRRLLALLVVAFACAALVSALAPGRGVTRTQAANDFVHFESGHVHPLAMTPDAACLLAVNTADDQLAVFDVTGASPVLVAEIPVGLEPVSVAVRASPAGGGPGEAWVVNQLSDDVSIVDLATRNVRATLHVGDEPADVVFAGTPARAWVSVSGEDALKVYDPSNLALAPTVVAIPARKPRSLSVSPDGASVYAAVFNSSHGATVLSEAEAGDSLPAPVPPMRAGLPAAPKVGLLAQSTSGHWRDVSGKLWDSKIPYSVPLVELVKVDAATATIAQVRGDMATILMGTAVDPATGTCAVSGTYALLELRFEPNVRGHVTESRVALVPPAGPTTVVGLNPHINYTVPTGPPSERDSSLAIPTGVAWSPDGQRVYVSAMGSDRLGVVSASGALLARVATVAGPTGVVVDGPRSRLYVLGRFHNQLQTLSTGSLQSLAVTSIGFDPTPDDIVNGRKFFYRGLTSGHGDQACASCHLFGDMDNLVWDLGDPTGDMAPVPPGMADPLLAPMHPMKGPMATQSLRGLSNTGVLHWRGDRASFMAFQPATQTLLGLASPIPDSEMVAMSQFVLPLAYPPNPNQFLDRTFRDAPAGSASAERGRVFFANTPVDGGRTCSFCHVLAIGTNGQLIDKFALQAAQDMKIPQLRNLYQKTGFTDAPGVANKRGFGFTHNGSVDNLFDFLHFPGFNFLSGAAGDAQRRDLEAYLLSFDTGMAPAVGAEVTFDGGTGDAARVARMDTLVARAAAGDCDLVAHGRVDGARRNWLLVSGSWRADRTGVADLSSAALRALAAPGAELTVLGVPPGSGTRIALDRDRDGYPNGDELAAGSDPANPASIPALTGVTPEGATATGLRGARPNPFRGGTAIEWSLARDAQVDLTVFDVLGREVRVLARGAATAGAHRIAWDGRGPNGRSVGAGLYFARLRVDGREWTRTIAKLD